ncbi:hypothetical protein DU002_17145 [Corallincola holothuriorum]|uniref:O-antigen ligase-related domain-containing protein n=2 Tax=Corallincola holothuriorum TaxID=2282215 RepID=A0A368N6H8_9GAMM|nr:hypothetical protein DU002_17145 [Corallincola holothuriorum]
MLPNNSNLTARIQQSIISPPVPTICFFLYMVFTIDFFIRISARIPGVSSIRPTLILVGIISLLLVFNLGRLKEKFQTPTGKILGILFVYIIITIPFVKWPGSVLRENIPDFIRAIVFFYFTLLIVDTNNRLRWFLFIFIGCQTFRVLEPLYLNLTEGYWGSSTYMGGTAHNRLAGGPYDVINGNELGFVIVTLVPFLHYFMIKKSWFIKLIYFSLLGMLLWALVLTMSRGALIALLVVAWFIFKNSTRKPLLIVVAICISIGGWSQMSDIQKDRYLSLTGADVRGAGSASGRVSGIAGELELAMNYPAFGHGVGTTAEAKYHKLGRTQASHSLYAELIIEIGIIGFFIFMRFLYVIYMNLKRIKELIKKSSESDELAEKISFEKDLVLAMTACFWMYVVYSINYWGLSVYYWYLFGGLCAVTTLLIERKATSIDLEQEDKAKGTL